MDVLGTGFHKFLRDESGGYTIWSLIWFSLYVAMGGLAVDMTDAYRNQTLLQSTADASSLAAVMSLPDQADGLAQALAYSTDNMNHAINGNVLDGAEVIFGKWSFATRSFAPGAIAPDAVHVITRRDEANNNPLATNFLRILALWGLPVDRWNISVEAIAVKYIPDCLRGGLVSYNAVNVTSGNGFHNKICIHGQNEIYDTREQDFAVSMGNGNTIDPGVTISMPYLEDMDGRPNIYENNAGLAEAMRAGDLWPKDAMAVGEMLASLQALSPEYMPGYVLDADGNIADGTVITVTDKTFPAVLLENHIYDVNCSSPNKLTKLPTGIVIKNVVIITECNISASHAAVIENALIASSALGNGKDGTNANTINLASDASLGANAFCTNGGDGGVEIYALASVHIAAKLNVRGLRAVVGGDFQLAAQGDAEGISVQAMDRIDATANGDFGLCPNGTLPPGQFAWHYRLVL